MTTKELFGEVVRKRNWHVGTGMSVNVAFIYKQRFLKDKLGEEAMSKILIKLGYTKKVVWVMEEK